MAPLARRCEARAPLARRPSDDRAALGCPILLLLSKSLVPPGRREHRTVAARPPPGADKASATNYLRRKGLRETGGGCAETTCTHTHTHRTASHLDAVGGAGRRSSSPSAGSSQAMRARQGSTCRAAPASSPTRARSSASCPSTGRAPRDIGAPPPQTRMCARQMRALTRALKAALYGRCAKWAFAAETCGAFPWPMGAPGGAGHSTPHCLAMPARSALDLNAAQRFSLCRILQVLFLGRQQGLQLNCVLSFSSRGAKI